MSILADPDIFADSDCALVVGMGPHWGVEVEGNIAYAGLSRGSTPRSTLEHRSFVEVPVATDAPFREFYDQLLREKTPPPVRHPMSPSELTTKDHHALGVWQRCTACMHQSSTGNSAYAKCCIAGRLWHTSGSRRSANVCADTADRCTDAHLWRSYLQPGL